MTRTIVFEDTGERCEVVMSGGCDGIGQIPLLIKPIPAPVKTLEEEVIVERCNMGFFVSVYQPEDWAAHLTALCRVLDRRLGEIKEGEITKVEVEE